MARKRTRKKTTKKKKPKRVSGATRAKMSRAAKRRPRYKTGPRKGQFKPRGR